MAILADRDKPFNRFLSNIIFGISCMMNLSSVPATINTAPVVPLKHYITLPFPSVGFKIVVSVIIATTFAVYFKQPLFTCKQEEQCYNQ
jgi:hypothetical protein